MIREVAPYMIVDSQLIAYRVRDLDRFIAHFDETAMVEFDTVAASLHGHAKIAAAYSRLFATAPNLTVAILQRNVVGNTVVDREQISGFSATAPHVVMESVATYQISGGLIQRLSFSETTLLHPAP